MVTLPNKPPLTQHHVDLFRITDIGHIADIHGYHRFQSTTLTASLSSFQPTANHDLNNLENLDCK